MEREKGMKIPDIFIDIPYEKWGASQGATNRVSQPSKRIGVLETS